MMDSDDFFGFDTTHHDDDGRMGGGDREDDDDFDALNDETFGTVANTGDWENQHRQLSGLLDKENQSTFNSTMTGGSSRVGGISIPGSSHHTLYGASHDLTNGLANLDLSSVNSSYSTPPKHSLIDPVKLSQSPGQSIWAPHQSSRLVSSMLSSSGEHGGGANSLASSSNVSSNLLSSLLQQSSSEANQQQMMSSQSFMQSERRPTSTFMPNGTNIFAGGGGDLNSQSSSNAALFSSFVANHQQQQMIGQFGLDGVRPSGGGGSGLPLGFSGNVKSVADLEREMRLQQQLMTTSNAPAETVIRAEDLERQATALQPQNFNKPLQPYFNQHQQQQLQQIQQQQQLQQMQQQKRMQHMQQQQQQRLSLHPLTGQPLNTGGVNMQQQQPQHPMNRMQQHPSYQQHLQQQQMLTNISKRQMNQQQQQQQQPPPHLNQNYHNFPNNQRNNYNNQVGGGYGGNNSGGNNGYNNGYNNGRHGGGNNWNNGDYDQRDIKEVYFAIDRHGNRRDYDAGRRHDNGYDRNNGQRGNQEYGNSNGGGRVRRDSEAEWEDWERKRAMDEYAGLMTPKQKSWLRNIQTMQLATDNPYRDDYYYVMHRAKKTRPHPSAPLRIEGLNMLLPALSDQDRDSTSNTYTPPNMENSLGKLQVASVNAPRKIIDLHVVHLDPSEPTTKLQMEMRTHRLLLLSIEKLYAEKMELEDFDRKIAILPDSPTRDSFYRHRKQLAESMWRDISSDRGHMLALLAVRKGKTLVVDVLSRLGPEASEVIVSTALTHLPQLTRNSQPQHQNTLNILWPIADMVLADASPKLLLRLASNLLPHLQDQGGSRSSGGKKGGELDQQKDGGEGKTEKGVSSELCPVLSSKFGISVIVGLLVRGEQLYSEMIKQESWQEFLSRVIKVLAGVQNPDLITNTLVRDHGDGKTVIKKGGAGGSGATPAVVVLGRGQTLSSITKQRSAALASSSTAAGRITPPLPLVAVTATSTASSSAGGSHNHPSAHLARCTEQVHSGALAAAQTALQNLEIPSVAAGNLSQQPDAGVAYSAHDHISSKVAHGHQMPQMQEAS